MVNGDAVTLDIYPGKFNGPGSDITGKKYDTFLGKYTKYEYEKSNKQEFRLSWFSHDSHRLTNVIISINDVRKVTTYFIGTTFLMLHVDSKNEQAYYASTNTSKAITNDTTFSNFVTTGKNKPLRDSDELKPILDSIAKYTKLYYERVSTDIKEYFWRRTDILFDLTNYPEKPDTKKYKSVVAGEDVTIEEEKNPAGLSGYNKVKHSIGTEPFFARQVKLTNGSYIELGNILPNEPLTEFTVYYKNGNNNPLLVLLKVKQLDDVTPLNYVPDKYLLSKNNGTKWDIRRIVGSLDDTELGEILGKIYSKQKLVVGEIEGNVQKKLTDISKDLIINLNGQFTAVHGNSVGSYDSEGKKIYYKIFTGGNTRIQHCYTFSGFTLKSVLFDGKHTISSNLPSYNDTVYGLSSYHYPDESNGNPLLLYLYYKGKDHWLKRQCGDTEWKSLENGDNPPISDVDSEKIKKLLEKLKTPNVTVDLSQPKEYTPTGSTLQFSVSGSEHSPRSGFWRFEHRWSNNRPFTVKSVTHGSSSTLKGISSEELIENVTAYYFGKDPSDEKKLLLVTLLKKSGDKKNVYYSRPLVSGYSWTMEKHEKPLDAVQLKPMLEALKMAHFPESNTGILAGTSFGTGLGGAGLGALAVWKGPALLARLIARL